MKGVIRLNEKELRKAALDCNLNTNIEIANKIGVSITQLWKTTLPPEDPRYNSPGASFIAGVLEAFDGPFERFFFLDQSVANANKILREDAK